MLSSSKYADQFDDGTALRCILVPTSYHHFHAPVSGTLIESNENVPGLYYDRDDFINFHRGYFIIKTEKYGHVAMVPVGLATISSVVFEDKVKLVNDNSPVEITKGEKLGHFAYGGSMVLLLFEKGVFEDLDVEQGQRIGRLRKPYQDITSEESE